MLLSDILRPNWKSAQGPQPVDRVRYSSRPLYSFTCNNLLSNKILYYFTWFVFGRKPYWHTARDTCANYSTSSLQRFLSKWRLSGHIFLTGNQYLSHRIIDSYPWILNQIIKPVLSSEGPKSRTNKTSINFMIFFNIRGKLF